jgi:hypothetical protein
MKRLIKKGLVTKGPGKQGKYYPTSEYRGPIMTADILGKLAAGMILENEDIKLNSPFLKKVRDEKRLTLPCLIFPTG